MKGKFLREKSVTAASILTILTNTEQDYMAASSGIGAEDKDAKADVTTSIFSSDDKVITLLSYWAVVLVSMNYVVDKSNMDYLLCSRRSYTPVQRAAIAARSVEDRVAVIAMNGGEFKDDNARAMMHLFQAYLELWRNR